MSRAFLDRTRGFTVNEITIKDEMIMNSRSILKSLRGCKTN